jgi:hypothetical protein
VRTRLPGLALAACTALALTAPGAARAAPPPPPLSVPDLTGPRSLALSAGLGLAGGTEALYENPAAMAARKRYVIDGQYIYDQRPGLPSPSDKGQYFGSAVVDSVSTPLAAGLSYLRADKGPQHGNIVQLGLAGPLGGGVFLGLTGKYYGLSGVEDVHDELNADAGLFWQVTPHIALGAAAHNLVSSDKDFTMPRVYGGGLTVGSETGLQAVFDWRTNLDACFVAGAPAVCGSPGAKRQASSQFGGGIEYLAGNLAPLRAGYQVDDVSKTNWLSFGIGIVTQSVGIDVGYRQSTKRSDARTIMVTLHGYLPNE